MACGNACIAFNIGGMLAMLLYKEDSVDFGGLGILALLPQLYILSDKNTCLSTNSKKKIDINFVKNDIYKETSF